MTPANGCWRVPLREAMMLFTSQMRVVAPVLTFGHLGTYSLFIFVFV